MIGGWTEPLGLDIDSTLNSFANQNFKAGEGKVLWKGEWFVYRTDKADMSELFVHGCLRKVRSIWFCYAICCFIYKENHSCIFRCPCARGTGSCPLAIVSDFVQRRKECWCFWKENIIIIFLNSLFRHVEKEPNWFFFFFLTVVIKIISSPD